MDKEKIKGFKKNSKRIISILVLLFLLDTGSKVGERFLNNVKGIKEFIEEYDGSVKKIIDNYPLVDSKELNKAKNKIIDNYFFVDQDELDTSFKRIVDNYPLVETEDKNEYILAYLKQCLDNANGNLNYAGSLKKVINSYFHQDTDFANDSFNILKNFIFENSLIDGISYDELNIETRKKCVEAYAALANILFEKEQTKRI